jgi:serine/threonine-protein kinase HipA
MIDRENIAELEVWFGTEQIGTAKRGGGGGLTFQHLEGYEGPALSESLPVRQEAYSSPECRPYFSGLLPESSVRIVIARVIQTDVNNDWALLVHLGGECAGAVSLVIPGTPLDRGPQEPRWLSEEEQAHLVSDLQTRPFLVDVDGTMRLSLAGAQNKIPVVADGERIGLPAGGAPSTHILKLADPQLPGIADNEATCMALVRACGVAAPAARAVTLGDDQALLVERYDRAGTLATLERLHQEDFAQALGVRSEDKYQSDGGPSVRDCVSLIRRATRIPGPNIVAFVDQLIMNFLIGNHDAHAKNYSLLYTSGGAQLAPMYDVLDTGIYGTSNFAMKIGGEYRDEFMFRRHWERLAEEVVLSGPQVMNRLHDLAARLDAAIDALNLADSPEVAAQIVPRIRKRIDRVRDFRNQ